MRGTTTRETVEETSVLCQCSTCRVHRAELGPGPYDPRQYALIAPPVIATSNGEPRVEHDADVVEATEARDTARIAFDLADGAWLEAVAAHRSAVLLAEPVVRDINGDTIGRRTGPRMNRGRVAELAEAEKEASERRLAAWRAVVKANDRIAESQMAARLAIVEAARSGQTSRKGR